jgi:hypothetical protein
MKTNFPPNILITQTCNCDNAEYMTGSTVVMPTLF